MLAVYGFWPGFSMTYWVFVSLEANLDRQLARVAVASAWGFNDSADSDMPATWADALARDPAEAEEISFAANSARQESRVRRRHGWQG